MLKSRGPNKGPKQLKFESRKNKNGSHEKNVPFEPLLIQIRERSHSCLSPFQRLIDLNRQFKQKSKYSDFNDSNLSCFLPFFGPRNLSIVRDLLNQMDLDRVFCELYVVLSVVGRFSTF